jgi:hypothetical protein
MIAIQGARRAAVIVLALLLALTLAVPLMGAKGNSGSAKACQKGGWETLAPAESPSTGFASEEACVAYGAKGGGAVPEVPALSIEFRAIIDGQYCVLQAQATAPDAEVIIEVTSDMEYYQSYTPSLSWSPVISLVLADSWTVVSVTLNGSDVPVTTGPLPLVVHCPWPA